MSKEKTIDGLCTRNEIAKYFGGTGNNIGKTYVNKKEKESSLKVINMGSYCMKNGIDAEKLKIFIEYGDRLVSLLSKEMNKEDEKIVLMSQEELEDYKKFKKFQQYAESQNK